MCIRCKHYTRYYGDNGAAFKSSEIKIRKKIIQQISRQNLQFMSLPRSRSYFHEVIGAEINVLATGKLSFSVILMICRTVRREGNDQEQQH